jgi:hypothetical protein
LVLGGDPRSRRPTLGAHAADVVRRQEEPVRCRFLSVEPLLEDPGVQIVRDELANGEKPTSKKDGKGYWQTYQVACN